MTVDDHPIAFHSGSGVFQVGGVGRSDPVFRHGETTSSLACQQRDEVFLFLSGSTESRQNLFPKESTQHSRMDTWHGRDDLPMLPVSGAAQLVAAGARTAE